MFRISIARSAIIGAAFVVLFGKYSMTGAYFDSYVNAIRAAEAACAAAKANSLKAGENFTSLFNSRQAINAQCGDCMNEGLWRKEYSNRKCYTVQKQDTPECQNALAKIKTAQSYAAVNQTVQIAMQDAAAARMEYSTCKASAMASYLAQQRAAEEAKKLAEKKRHEEIKKHYEAQQKKKQPKKVVKRRPTTVGQHKNKAKWTDDQKNAAAQAAAIDIINMAVGLSGSGGSKKHKKRASPKKSGHKKGNDCNC